MCMRWILRVLLGVSTSLPLSCLCYAGPVNSRYGFPLAVMNTSGDFIAAGDIKLLATWTGSYGQARTAAAPFRFSNPADAAFTGGVAERHVSQGEPVGIVCASTRAALYFPERSLRFPAGRWQEIRAVGGERWQDHAIVCAMRPDGLYAIYVPDLGRVLFSNGSTATLNGLGGESVHLVAMAETFALLSSDGSVHCLIAGQNDVAVQGPQRHHLGWLTSQSRFSGNRRYLLRADDSAVTLSRLTKDETTGGCHLVSPVRLPVSPCEEEQTCGVSLAADDSWLVTGYWGTYVGLSDSFIRLRMPNFSLDYGGVAIAHQGLAERFVYLGNEDGDLGSLPPESGALGDDRPIPDNPPEEPPRWVVWLKPQEKACAEKHAALGRPSRGRSTAMQAYLFPWRRNGGSAAKTGGNAILPVVVFQGELPEPVPSDWVAWERQVELHLRPRPPLGDNAESPTGEVSELNALWWPHAVGRDEAFVLASDAGVHPESVLVAVLDSGAQLDHPWLRGALYTNAAEVPNNELDDDENGFVDDVSGYDFVDEDAYPEDRFGHGTHVAGLVGALDPETGDPVGVNTNVALLIVRALDASGKSNSIDLARALAYAVDQGADFVNCSWGGGASTQALRDAFGYAHAQDVLLFSSAGNDATDTDTYPQVPTMYPGVLSVGALNSQGALAGSSNYGAHSVDYLAPGEGIVSTAPGRRFQEMSGTSMASAIAVNTVSWVFGLLRTLHPYESAAALGARMRQVICASSSTAGLTGRSRCGALSASTATAHVLLEP